MSRTVLVTGASSGIGSATAIRFARQGAEVVLVGRDESRLARVAERIADSGGRAKVVPSDLAEPGAAEALAERFGHAELIVHAAGAGQWKPLIETGPAEMRSMMAVPTLAAMELVRAFAPAMMARGHGRFVFVTSPGSWLVWPNATAYLAARHALKAVAEGAAAELRKSGVGVTLVALGEVESPYWTHNPGSRENLPPALPVLMAPLTVEQAAAIIEEAVLDGRSLIVRPRASRLAIAINGIAPGLVARWMRMRSSRKS